MMPASDQFTERLVVPTHFLRIPSRQGITTLWAIRSETRVTGAIPAASTLDSICYFFNDSYVNMCRGLVSRSHTLTIALDATLKGPEVRISKGIALFSFRQIASWLAASRLLTRQSRNQKG
jgi:hypothetical protein